MSFTLRTRLTSLSTYAPLLRPNVSSSLQTPLQTRLASAGSHQGNPDWSGRQTEENVANRGDELDVQSGASQSGKRERESGDEKQSQATTEKDAGNQNEQAKKDHPEAPGPVIGMNDERGQVSLGWDMRNEGKRQC